MLETLTWVGIAKNIFKVRGQGHRPNALFGVGLRFDGVGWRLTFSLCSSSTKITKLKHQNSAHPRRRRCRQEPVLEPWSAALRGGSGVSPSPSPARTLSGLQWHSRHCVPTQIPITAAGHQLSADKVMNLTSLTSCGPCSTNYRHKKDHVLLIYTNGKLHHRTNTHVVSNR